MGITAREKLRAERERREKDERRKMGRETEREMHARLLSWCDCPVCSDSPPGNKEEEDVALAVGRGGEVLRKCACSHCEGHEKVDLDQQGQSSGLTKRILASGQSSKSKGIKPREMGRRETVALHRNLLSWCDCKYCKDEPSMRPGAPHPALSTKPEPEPVQDILGLTATDISTTKPERPSETIAKRHARISGICRCLHCSIAPQNFQRPYRQIRR